MGKAAAARKLASAAAYGGGGLTAVGAGIYGVLRAEATLAAANLVYLLLLAGGAVVIPASSYGGFGDVARYLPSGALGESMRFALIDSGIDGTGLLVLLAWGLLGTALTARTFKWE